MQHESARPCAVTMEEAKSKVGYHDPTVTGPAFLASLDALVEGSRSDGGSIDEDALRFCLQTLDDRISELKVCCCRRCRVPPPFVLVGCVLIVLRAGRTMCSRR